MLAKELNELAQRKRLILLESGLHRGLVEAESLALRERLESVQSVFDTGRHWFHWGGAAADLLTARRGRGRGLTYWISSALAAWRWIRRPDRSRD
jgi:hypothetical protein